jgi:hypothetical protein
MIDDLRKRLKLWHWVAVAGALVVIVALLAMVIGPHFPFRAGSTS